MPTWPPCDVVQPACLHALSRPAWFGGAYGLRSVETECSMERRVRKRDEVSEALEEP